MHTRTMLTAPLIMLEDYSRRLGSSVGAWLSIESGIAQLRSDGCFPGPLPRKTATREASEERQQTLSARSSAGTIGAPVFSRRSTWHRF